MGRMGIGVRKLSQLEIDADKDWAAKKISNIAEISIGDIVFKNNYRLTEVPYGIALVNPEGEIVKLFEEVRNDKRRD